MKVAPDVSGRAGRCCQVPTTPTVGEVAAPATRFRRQIPSTTTCDKKVRSSDGEIAESGGTT
jgi:hypothetical protein